MDSYTPDPLPIFIIHLILLYFFKISKLLLFFIRMEVLYEKIEKPSKLVYNKSRW